MAGKKILKGFAEWGDLPGEPHPKLPLIEIIDNRRVLIEQHKGVKGYGNKEICICVAHGAIVVRGCNLELSQMTSERIIVTGLIECVVLQKGK